VPNHTPPNVNATNTSETGIRNMEQVQIGYSILHDALEQVQRTIEPSRQFQIFTKNMDNAASALYDSLYNFYFDLPCPPLPLMARVSNLNASALNAPECHFSVYVLSSSLVVTVILDI
jgi:hypothetical protein